MSEVVKCVDRNFFTSRQIHPEAVAVEWRPQTLDWTGNPDPDHLATSHPDESIGAPVDSQNT